MLSDDRRLHVTCDQNENGEYMSSEMVYIFNFIILKYKDIHIRVPLFSIHRLVCKPMLLKLFRNDLE